MTGDPYWDNVVFLSGYEGGTVVDESPLAQTVTLTGTTAASSSVAKYGTQSLSHPTYNAGGATVPNHASFDFGSAPFTIETFVYHTANLTFADEGQYYVSLADDGATYPDDYTWYFIYIYSSITGHGQLGMTLQDDLGGYLDIGYDVNVDPTINTHHHVAVDFDGTDYRVFFDGVMKSKVSGDVRTIRPSNAKLCIGSYTTDGVPSTSVANRFVGYLDETRVTAGVSRYGSDASFTPPTEAFPRGPENDLDVTIEEDLGLADGAGMGDVFIDTLSQGIGVQPIQTWGWHGSLADEIGANYLLDVIRAQPATATSGIGMASTFGIVRGIAVVEQLRIALSQVPNHHFQKTLNDGTGIDPAVNVGIPVVIAEGMGVQLTQLAQHAVTIMEELGLLSAIAPAFIYNKSISDAIRLADSLGRFFGVDLTDDIGIAQTQVATASRLALVDEDIGLAAAATPRMVIRVTATDEIDLADDQVLRMFFSQTIAEGIELSAAYLSPGDSVTTWAMNTRTGAVSEYSNYAFNSFARMGNIYLGASDSGLYTLLGDDDAGTDIVAQIKSGFAQWAGSRFTIFKGIYLGVRGEGDFVLKLVTGDGNTYNYGVSTRDMRTTRVHTGKGLRARYFSFELISTGQDFDLDTIEFVPLVAERRV